MSHFTDRHELTTLPGSPDGKTAAITTTDANTATEHGERLDGEYEPVTSPLGGCVVPSPPPPSHPPLPPPPVAPKNGVHWRWSRRRECV